MNQALQLVELANLLTLRRQPTLELERVVELAQRAYASPEAFVQEHYEDSEWLLEFASSADVRSWVLFSELEVDLFVSDKADELHEQIEDFLEEDTRSFPDCPHDIVLGSQDYFVWLDRQLEGWNPQQSGYSLLMVGNTYSDNLQTALVYRKDVAQILNLCRDLEIKASKTTDLFKNT
jgi:hypothetical protein